MIGDPALTDGAPAVGDLDSDGDLDVAWGRSGGGVGIQLNNGSGTFAAPIYLASPQSGRSSSQIYNGDGRPDLALPIGRVPEPVPGVSQHVRSASGRCPDHARRPAGPVLEGENFAYNVAAVNNGPIRRSACNRLHFRRERGVRVRWGRGKLQRRGNAGRVPGWHARERRRRGIHHRGAAKGGPHAAEHRRRDGMTSDPNPGNNAAFATTTVTPAASTLVVTNTNRSGPGSLYQAIVDANDPGPRDTITFNIPGPGPHTIVPTGDLPDITQPVVIDGTTQPDYAGTPLIEINGQNAGTAFGLVVNGSNSIVRGLAINRFHHVGIVLSGAGGHRLEANFIGTNTSGTAALGNLEQGVFISSPNNVIGGATAAARNVISGNTAQGVIILGAAATGNVVSGNFIGSNVSGTARIPNGVAGVAVIGGASNNTIGGTTAGAGNLISGNAGPGVSINRAGTNGNTVAGNLIGTNAAGTAALVQRQTSASSLTAARPTTRSAARRWRHATSSPGTTSPACRSTAQGHPATRLPAIHRDECGGNGGDPQRPRHDCRRRNDEQHDWRSDGQRSKRDRRQHPNGRSSRGRRNDRQPGARKLHWYERHRNGRRSQWRLRCRCQQYRGRERDWRRADRRGQRHLGELISGVAFRGTATDPAPTRSSATSSARTRAAPGPSATPSRAFSS